MYKKNNPEHNPYITYTLKEIAEYHTRKITKEHNKTLPKEKERDCEKEKLKLKME